MWLAADNIERARDLPTRAVGRFARDDHIACTEHEAPMTADPSNPLPDLSAALESLVAKAAPNVVAVHSRRSRSSGFLWRPGLIVTGFLSWMIATREQLGIEPTATPVDDRKPAPSPLA